jgi:YD repeat-containing protein
MRVIQERDGKNAGGSYTLGGASAGSPLIKKLALPNSSYITNTYDNVARLLSTRLNNSSHTTQDSAVYGYNAGHQRTAFTNAADTYARYTYDEIGQLTVVRTTNSGGAVISGETEGYYYDTAWNLNRRTNSSSGSSTAFSVDGKNQLTAGPHSGYL